MMDAFLLSVDRENGSLRLNPLDVLSYPYKTTQVFMCLQAVFMDHLAEVNKAARKPKRGYSSPGGGRRRKGR